MKAPRRFYTLRPASQIPRGETELVHFAANDNQTIIPTLCGISGVVGLTMWTYMPMTTLPFRPGREACEACAVQWVLEH